MRFKPAPGFWLRIAAVSLLAGFLALGQAIQAQAHANILRSDPADNSVLPAFPPLIKIWFSEPVAPDFSTANLLDVNGVQVTTPQSVRFDASDPTLLILEPPALGDGIYTVTWRAASASDAHATSGLFVFRVGSAGAAGPAAGASGAASDSPPLSLPESILRWLNYFGLLALVGAAGIPLLVIVPPSASQSGAAEIPGLSSFYRRVTGRIYLLGALAASFVFAVGLLYLVWQMASLATSDSAPASLSAVNQMLFHTSWGYAWIARQALAAVLIPLFTGLAQASLPSRYLRWLAFGLIAAALAAQAVTSHAAGGRSPALPVLVDWLHLLFVGLWVGGLFALGVSILPILKQEQFDFKTIARATWGRFGPLAAFSVGVVLATGLYSTGQRVISADALLLTSYGQLLAVKIGLMLFAGLAGLLNSLSLHPALSAPLGRWLKKPPGWTPFAVRRLPGLILVEMGLGIVIVLLAGALTSLAPADAVKYSIAPEAQPAQLVAQVDDLVVTLAVKPNRPGSNVINILAPSTRRPAPAEVLRVIVRMTYLEQDFGALSVDAQPAGPDAYRASLDSLTQPGRWKMDVVVRRKGIPDSVASFTWTLLPLGDLQPTLISRSPWKDALSVLSGLLALLLVLAFGLSYWQGRRPRPAPQPGGRATLP